MRLSAFRFLTVVALSLLAPAAAFAHDVWIVPSSFTPASGELLAVRLKVGHPRQEVEPLKRNPQRLLRLAAVSESAEVPLLGQDGADPAGWGRLTEPGLQILVYEGSPAHSELPAERFEHYLLEEGLDGVLAERRQRGETARPGRELYSRCLKSLIRVEGRPEGLDRALGLDFELVLEEGPATAPPQSVQVRALRRGLPAPGVLIELVRLDGGGEVQGARSDGEGRVVFAGAGPGAWLLTAVTADRVAAPGAEWHSIWTSLTFERP